MLCDMQCSTVNFKQKPHNGKNQCNGDAHRYLVYPSHAQNENYTMEFGFQKKKHSINWDWRVRKDNNKTCIHSTHGHNDVHGI